MDTRYVKIQEDAKSLAHRLLFILNTSEGGMGGYGQPMSNVGVYWNKPKMYEVIQELQKLAKVKPMDAETELATYRAALQEITEFGDWTECAETATAALNKFSSPRQRELGVGEDSLCCENCDRWDQLHPCGKKGRCRKLGIVTYFTFYCNVFKEAHSGKTD